MNCRAEDYGSYSNIRRILNNRTYRDACNRIDHLAYRSACTGEEVTITQVRRSDRVSSDRQRSSRERGSEEIGRTSCRDRVNCRSIKEVDGASWSTST